MSQHQDQSFNEKQLSQDTERKGDACREDEEPLSNEELAAVSGGASSLNHQATAYRPFGRETN